MNIFDYRKLNRSFRQFYFLFKKNIHLIFRDRLLFFLILLTPFILFSFFIFAMQSNLSTSHYRIGIINYDDNNVDYPYLNLSSRASMDFIEIASNLDDYLEGDFGVTFEVIDTFQNITLDPEYGKYLCDEAILDVLITFPENFSEEVFGSTWWYGYLYNTSFANISEVINSYGLDAKFEDIALLLLNNTDFPVDQIPNFSIYINPDIISRNLIANTITQIIDNQIMFYNDIDSTEIKITNRNNVGDIFITRGDSFMPYYIVLAALIPICSSAILMVREKKDRTLSLEDITHVSRFTNFLSMEASQLLIASIQIPILMGTMVISGFYINPSINYGLLFLVLILHFFISINIGMLIGVSTKSSNAAALMGTMMIIIFLLLGGTFGKTDSNLRFIIPTYYTNNISSFIITEGKSFLFALPYIGILVLFCIGTFFFAMFLFKNKKFEDIL